MLSKNYLMLRVPGGRVSKHAQPRCSKFLGSLLRRDDEKGSKCLVLYIRRAVRGGVAPAPCLPALLSCRAPFERKITEGRNGPMTATNPYETGLDKNAANFVPLTPVGFLRRSASVYPNRLAIAYGGGTAGARRSALPASGSSRRSVSNSAPGSTRS
jgi:hypothetical protein